MRMQSAAQSLEIGCSAVTSLSDLLKMSLNAEQQKADAAEQQKVTCAHAMQATAETRVFDGSADVPSWKDTNMALFGSDIEYKIKEAAAQTEPQWTGAGSQVGLQVWRIEQFKVVTGVLQHILLFAILVASTPGHYHRHFFSQQHEIAFVRDKPKLV